MRYSSVGWTPVVPLRERRRLEFLVCNKCRLPARERKTFPLAVILKRFATDFLVLIPFGRRIYDLFFQKSGQYRWRVAAKQDCFISISSIPHGPKPGMQSKALVRKGFASRRSYREM